MPLIELHLSLLDLACNFRYSPKAKDKVSKRREEMQRDKDREQRLKREKEAQARRMEREASERTLKKTAKKK